MHFFSGCPPQSIHFQTSIWECYNGLLNVQHFWENADMTVGIWLFSVTFTLFLVCVLRAVHDIAFSGKKTHKKHNNLQKIAMPFTKTYLSWHSFGLNQIRFGIWIYGQMDGFLFIAQFFSQHWLALITVKKGWVLVLLTEKLLSIKQPLIIFPCVLFSIFLIFLCDHLKTTASVNIQRFDKNTKLHQYLVL